MLSSNYNRVRNFDFGCLQNFYNFSWSWSISLFSLDLGNKGIQLLAEKLKIRALHRPIDRRCKHRRCMAVSWAQSSSIFVNHLSDSPNKEYKSVPFAKKEFYIIKKANTLKKYTSWQQPRD